jgi:plastocyanin
MSGNDRQGAVSGDNPTIRILRNDTLTFNVSATGHPFWLKTAESTGTGDAIPGVSNNGAEEGTVAYQFTSTGTFYYACEIHSSMAGPIVVT